MNPRIYSPRKLTCHPPKRTISIGHYIFQPSFLRRYVSFQGAYFLRNSFWHQNYTQEVLAVISYHFKHRGSFWMMINPTLKNGETFVNQPYKKRVVGLPGYYPTCIFGKGLGSHKERSRLGNSPIFVVHFQRIVFLFMVRLLVFFGTLKSQGNDPMYLHIYIYSTRIYVYKYI